jgi:hypothetical protein
MMMDIPEEIGCALLAIAVAIAIAIVVWAFSGFPGLR